MDDKKNIKKGVCRNYGNCDKANTQEVIEIEKGKPFECPECHEPLTALEDNGGGGGTPPLVKYLVIAAIVVGIIVVLWYIFGFKQSAPVDSPKEKDSTEVIEQSEPPTETLQIAEPTPTEPEEEPTEKIEKKEPIEQPKTAGPTSTPQTAPQSVLGGAATMTTSGGYTTIKFKRAYNLDMGDADHSTLSISAGDEIYMANVRNGYLYGGQLKYRGGEEKSLSGIKVRL